MELPIKVVGEHDDATVQQLQRCVDAEEGAIGVLCADGHLGYSMPIGGVVAYRHHISPSGVGYDIGCGNKAVRLDVRTADVRLQLPQIATEISKRISFGIGRANAEKVEHPILDEIAHSPVTGQRKLVQLAESQLGTVGSGNHYVDLLEDEEGYLWVACHFGSRGFGHKTAKGFLAIAQGKSFEDQAAEGEMNSPPVLLPLSSPSGQDYFIAMELALKYAYAGRDWVVERVRQILGNPDVTAVVHNNHNFAQMEEHFGDLWCVVRKGATPAFPLQAGFVGGSMGDVSVIVRGLGGPKAERLLYSTVHGAGRVMSRRQAAGKIRIRKVWTCGERECGFVAPAREFRRARDGQLPKCACGGKLHLRMEETRISEGRVNWPAVQSELREKGIILIGGGADEAPEVYRPLGSVLSAHGGTIYTVQTLRPMVVVMAGKDEFDPYKD